MPPEAVRLYGDLMDKVGGGGRAHSLGGAAVWESMENMWVSSLQGDKWQLYGDLMDKAREGALYGGGVGGLWPKGAAVLPEERGGRLQLQCR